MMPNVLTTNAYSENEMKNCPVCNKPLGYAEGIGDVCSTDGCPVFDDADLWESGEREKPPMSKSKQKRICMQSECAVREELQRVIDGKWISVEDRLPESNKIVIVNGGIAMYDSNMRWVTMTGDGSNVIQWKVTRWQPLPTPPEDV